MFNREIKKIASGSNLNMQFSQWYPLYTFLYHKRVRAQSTLEYTVIISVIVAALLSMQVYIKRGLQGKLRATADEIGQAYDPGNTTSDITITSKSDITKEVRVEEGVDPATGKKTIETITTVITSATEKRDGDETVGELGSSLF